MDAKYEVSISYGSSFSQHSRGDRIPFQNFVMNGKVSSQGMHIVNKIVAAFQGMHVSPVKHGYA